MEHQSEELTNEEIILAGLGDLEGHGRKRKLGARNIGKREIGASRFRRQFLERVYKLPKPVQKALVRGQAQVSDAPWYSTAPINGTRAELIRTSVSEQIGITNIDNGKLGKDRHLTLSAIRLLYDAVAIDGAFIDQYPADLLNGEWELELNGKKVFPKQPIRKFFDGFFGYNINKPFGLYVLINTKNVEPQTPIEFNVDLPNAVPGFLKVFLEGTTIFGY